jgi:pyruvate,water dikinase
VHRVGHLGARAPGPELWSNFSLREDLRLPLTPLSLGLWRDFFLPVVFESLTGLPRRATRERRLLPVDLISGRLYWNANRMLATPVGALLLKAAPYLDRRAGAALQAVRRGALLQAPSLSSLRKLWALGRGLLGLAGVLRRALGGLRIAAAVRASRRFAAQQLRAAAAPLDQVADEELITRAARVAGETREALRRGLAHELLGVLGLHAVRALWPEAPLQGVGRHGARVAPGALTVELRRLAATLRRASDLPLPEDPAELAELIAAQKESRQAWRVLLERSGHRAANELELAAPRWRDDPAPLLRALQAATAAAGQRLPEMSATARALPWGLRWLSALVGNFMLLRDFPRWAFAAGLDHLRRLYLESGRRLVERGKLASRNDVFMLEAEEVRDLLLGLRQQQQLVQARVRERQRAHARDLADRPPDALRSDGLLADPPDLPDPAANTRSGLPAAAGRVRAPARIMDDASGREAPPRGEVLVVTALTPGWAPMLCGAAALITEAGDWASHAAAMAREAGLPAVLSVPDATRWLRDGDEVDVDGDRGLVELVARRPF